MTNESSFIDPRNTIGTGKRNVILKQEEIINQNPQLSRSQCLFVKQPFLTERFWLDNPIADF